MADVKDNQISIARQKAIINEILELISDPIHRTIINAYGGEDPVRSMELELGRVLLDIWNNKNENKKP